MICEAPIIDKVISSYSYGICSFMFPIIAILVVDIIVIVIVSINISINININISVGLLIAMYSFNSNFYIIYLITGFSYIYN